jgi:hypothetical protein
MCGGAFVKDSRMRRALVGEQGTFVTRVANALPGHPRNIRGRVGFISGTGCEKTLHTTIFYSADNQYSLKMVMFTLLLNSAMGIRRNGATGRKKPMEQNRGAAIAAFFNIFVLINSIVCLIVERFIV